MTAVEDENHQLKDKEEVLNTHVNSLRNEISNFELV
jgi:cell division protein FtsB